MDIDWNSEIEESCTAQFRRALPFIMKRSKLTELADRTSLRLRLDNDNRRNKVGEIDFWALRDITVTSGSLDPNKQNKNRINLVQLYSFSQLQSMRLSEVAHQSVPLIHSPSVQTFDS